MLGVLALGGVAAFFIRSRSTEAPIAAASLAQPSAPAPADAVLPPAAQSDAQVRGALSPISPRDLFQRWLGESDLLDRLAVVADNLSEDRSPIAQLPFLRPSRAFSVSRKGSRLTISARSMARYDAFANVVSSIDEKKAAAAYKTLHPLLESAYHALGYPGRPLDGVVTAALQRVVDAPVRDDVVLRAAGVNYVFADAQLEAMGPVEKQLLRMGPRNTRLLQTEARELATAIGLPLRGQPQAKH
jgi:hypothetical protein